ncbi:MAG: HTTM domain-containing protein [Sandaracinaceae bacterium]|jgi:vitamin K-dependent gamma-carboxylase|nr:HTTM domain-containing protein [Sandaracinaceae bacterium]MBP7680355.1 HTTM domain-containing protein [Deltaproteobacteria bacterium]
MSAPSLVTRVRERLSSEVDIASVAVFRVLFFGLMCASSVRFMAEGWVERCFVQPSFFFHYWGASAVQVLSPSAMMTLHVVMAVSAALACVGLLYRVAAPVFLLSFVYVELCDVSNYLNHYYQAALLALLFCVVPAHRALSLDARLRPGLRRDTLPAWCLFVLRFQVGVVYVFAGLAKAQPDWLLHGQPLGIWLAARTETPLFGPLFGLPHMPLIMSWAGFLFDSTIVFWLLLRRTRPYAYALVIVFHALTHVLFHIGIFPFLMMLSAPIFFDADWPRHVVARLGRARSSAPRLIQRTVASPTSARLTAPLTLALALYMLVQVALPLRAHAYGGNVLWHEQGMRFSFRVMVRSKTGAVTYRVRARGLVNEQRVEPCRYLNALQEREMAGQPDLILQLAHRIAADYRARGHEDVQVRADVFVSLNGRPSQRLIDPDVDLAGVRDGLSPACYILPAPTTPPLHTPPPPRARTLALGR